MEKNPAGSGRTSCLNILISSVHTRATSPAGAPDLGGELRQRDGRQHLHSGLHAGAGESLEQASPGCTAPPAGS